MKTQERVKRLNDAEAFSLYERICRVVSNTADVEKLEKRVSDDFGINLDAMEGAKIPAQNAIQIVRQSLEAWSVDPNIAPMIDNFLDQPIKVQGAASSLSPATVLVTTLAASSIQPKNENGKWAFAQEGTITASTENDLRKVLSLFQTSFIIGTNNTALTNEGINFNTGEEKVPRVFPELQEEESVADYITYEVLYGTNRSKNKKAAAKKQFGYRRDSVLHVGVCTLSIPRNHTSGELERPSWFRELVFGESKKKHFTLLSVTHETPEAFAALIQQKIGSTGSQDALVFIHGFNTTFDDAMLRTAQIGYDLNFKGSVFSFSWPSKGSIQGYVYDMDSARNAGIQLKNFLSLIVKDGNIKKMHILAHSMGNVVLTEALRELKQEQHYPLPEINQIILAAPDIDQREFLDNIYPKIYSKVTPPRITLYASSKDKALHTAEGVRFKEPRVGLGGDALMIMDGIDTVDASDVDTSWLGHGYFAETKNLITDLFLLLSGAPPEKRILDAREKIVAGVNRRYWILRR